MQISLGSVQAIPPRGPIRRFRDWISGEAAPGVLLLMAAGLALVWANSPLALTYERLFSTPVTVGFGDLSLTKPILLWINDGLMAVFFLLVGLEIKREIVSGQLSGRDQAALPLAAAVGGMLVPAGLYWALNVGGDGVRGWGIPMATDIAFALGVLALVGSRAPVALKVFVTAVAVVDDLGAVAVIALFYTETVSVQALAVGAGVLMGLWGLNRGGVRRLAPYLLLGLVLWVAVLKSGVHATVAGVALAATIPAGTRSTHSPLVRLEHGLHPWVMLGVMPIFALANAGLRLGSDVLGPALMGPVALGIILGLTVGKPLGIVGMAWIVTRLGWAALPAGVSWGHVVAAGMLSGIGFTMSLFISQLAFGAGVVLEAAKVGILAASAVSAVGAWMVLARITSRETTQLPIRIDAGHPDRNPGGIREAA